MANLNQVTLFNRWVNSSNNIATMLSINNGIGSVVCTEFLKGVPNTVVNVSDIGSLVQQTDYYLINNIDSNSNTIEVQVYNSNGSTLGTKIFDSNPQSLMSANRGYSGYLFQPYYYDFQLKVAAATKTDFVWYRSVPFESQTPVDFTSLSANYSTPVNLIGDLQPIVDGDATLTYNQVVNNVQDAILVNRIGNQWIGGVYYDSPIYMGDPYVMSLEGSIYPISYIQGEYRAVLMDLYGSVLWMEDITSLSANQWNNFSIPINPNLLPVGYQLHIQNIGYYNSNFYLANIAMNNLTIDWKSSVDDVTWQSFQNTVNEPYSGVKFANPGTGLQIKGVAKSDQGWIESYLVKPHYQQ